MDFNGIGGFPPPYTNTDIDSSYSPIENDMFNPINQYEQAYMYYRYMTQMMDYKIKCKEYEKICKKTDINYKNSET